MIENGMGGTLMFEEYIHSMCVLFFVNQMVINHNAVALKRQKPVLRALNTFGNCQRPVFSLGVSHHKHKITSL